jgi:hypothetical protein
MQNADFPHWIIYARCGHSGFPQAVNKHSAGISESKEKFSKSSKIQTWFCNPEGVSGYPEDSEVYKSGEKGNKSKWPQKVQETKKDKGVSPQWSRQFCLWINP